MQEQPWKSGASAPRWRNTQNRALTLNQAPRGDRRVQVASLANCTIAKLILRRPECLSTSWKMRFNGFFPPRSRRLSASPDSGTSGRHLPGGNTRATRARKNRSHGDATPEMREVSKRAKDALIRIAKESKINATRLKPYGIEVDSKPAASASETTQH